MCVGSVPIPYMQIHLASIIVASLRFWTLNDNMGVQCHARMPDGLALWSDGPSSFPTSMQWLQTPDRNGRGACKEEGLWKIQVHTMGILGKGKECIHTCHRFLLKTNKITYQCFYSRFFPRISIATFLYSPFIHNMACYNTRRLHSDLTQVQSGMLLVCNGICSSKFHRALLAASNAFFRTPPAISIYHFLLRHYLYGVSVK